MITAYVTTEQAQGYIKTFRGTEALTAFSSLPEDDQSAALMSAQLVIDRQRYWGRKADPDQREAFPRIVDGQDIGIPEEVQLAVSLQAYAGISGALEAAQMAANLKAAGVTNYHLDDFSVSFGAGSESGEALSARDGLAEDVYRLLQPFMETGGVAYVIR